MGGRFDPVGDLYPLAVSLLNFYKKLLACCDYTDSIHNTPTMVVEFPERCDDTSNAPLPAVDKFVSSRGSGKNLMEVICVFLMQKNLHRTTDHFSGNF